MFHSPLSSFSSVVLIVSPWSTANLLVRIMTKTGIVDRKWSVFETAHTKVNLMYVYTMAICSFPYFQSCVQPLSTSWPTVYHLLPC